TATERSWAQDALDLMASLLERHCPLDQLLEVCQITLPKCTDHVCSPTSERRIRLGVSRDQAFCFYYEASLDELRRQGAEIVEFSALAGNRLPAGLDALYFGGGYPELHAECLGHQTKLLSDVHEFARAGKPVYGECGGLIFLSRELITRDGTKWPMAGLLPLS